MEVTKPTFIKELKLKNYKGFKSFSVNFSGSAYLIGPNNAGKSTLIQAMRTCAYMLDYAYVKKPNERKYDGKIWVSAYSFSNDQFSLIAENIRHEFKEEETRLELTFSNESKLIAVWPSGDGNNGDSPFFYLSLNNKKQPSGPVQVKLFFPKLGIIPTLMPIEHIENLLSEEYVKRNVDTKRSSRHVRNYFYLFKENKIGNIGYEELLEYIKLWTPELEITEVAKALGDDGYELSVYYKEVVSRVEKELSWIGDGMQIWLQILLHLLRLKDFMIIILDEPDVYLHADLQRRLVRLLESHKQTQVITATHSSEVLGEAEKRHIIWVDRLKNNAIRSPKEELLEQFSESLGTLFNLRLARALRTKTLLFVEGSDMKIIRHIAKTVGANFFSNEQNITIIPLAGHANWEHVEHFKWIAENFLDKSVVIYIILDRDYRTNPQNNKIKLKLEDLGINVHIWERKELESYLLSVSSLARISGAPVEWIQKELDKICEKMEIVVQNKMRDEVLKDEGKKRTPSKRSADSINFDKTYKKRWSKIKDRIILCPPKLILKNLNKSLLINKFKTLSAVAIAEDLKIEEIPQEMVEIIQKIESSLN